MIDFKKINWKKTLFFSFLIILILWSLNNYFIGSPNPLNFYNEETAYDTVLSKNISPSLAMGDMQALEIDSEVNVSDKKLEKTYNLDLVVENKDEFFKTVNTLLGKYNAYIKNFSNNNEFVSSYSNLVVKVPSDKSDNFITELKNYVKYVNSESLNIDDVSLSYYDLEAEIKSAKEEEKQYLKILDKSRKIEDILNTTKYLNEVRSRISVLESQFKLMQNRVDYAVIYISVRNMDGFDSVSSNWQISKTFHNAINDLIANTKSSIENMIYYLITNVFKIIFYIVILIILYIIYKKKIK